MSAILNPGFETAGALPGQAEHWTLACHTAHEVIAGFGPGQLLGWEGFERWYDLLRDLDHAQTVLAFFDPHAEGYEDFDEAWDNDLYLHEVPTGYLVAAAFGSSEVEDLEAGWDNVPFARNWTDVADSPAVFDGEDTETYEHGWHDNEHYVRLWSAVPSSAALFDSAVEPQESFSGTWDPATTI